MERDTCLRSLYILCRKATKPPLDRISAMKTAEIVELLYYRVSEGYVSRGSSSAPKTQQGRGQNEVPEGPRRSDDEENSSMYQMSDTRALTRAVASSVNKFGASGAAPDDIFEGKEVA